MGSGSRIWSWLGILVGGLYLLNPTAGIFEFLPDNIPLIGNLDEAGAAILVVRCIDALRRPRVPPPGPVRPPHV